MRRFPLLLLLFSPLALAGGALTLMLGSGDGITLSGGDGGTVLQVDAASPYNTTVGIRFNTDGTIETGKSLNGAAITWTAAGNWIDPTSAASNVYDVRFTNFNGAGGGDWTSEAAADDIWIDLVTAVRTWTMNSTVQETISFTADFEVRDGDGAPPVTGTSSYTFSIQNLVWSCRPSSSRELACAASWLAIGNAALIRADSTASVAMLELRRPRRLADCAPTVPADLR